MAHTAAARILQRLFAQAQQRNRTADPAAPIAKRPLRRGPRLSRRRFVQGALAGGAALALGGRMQPLHAAPNAITPVAAARIAVIGGGLAGLNAAYQLKKRGLNATVYEARPRLGGRIHSVRGTAGPGLVLEMGAAFINTDHADLLALVEELGLELFNRDAYAAALDEEQETPATAYFAGGRLRTEAEVAEALREIAAQIAADSAALDADWETYAPEIDALSVADYLDLHADRMPEEWIRRLLETTIRTEYGVEPHESSALQLIFLLPTVEDETAELLGTSDEVYEVVGGNSRIIAGLAEALDGQIHRNMRLTRLAETETGYRLAFHNGEEVEADYVVLAIPFPVLRQIDLAVELPDGLRRFIQQVGPGRNEKLYAGYEQRSWLQPHGFSLAIWTDDDHFTEAWDAATRQPESEASALTFYLGGNSVTASRPGSVLAQGQALVDRLEAMLPGTAEAANGRFLRTGWTRSPFTQGGYTTFGPGQYTEFGSYLYIDAGDPEERQEVYAGRIVFAGEQFSDAFYGYMNGAAETGRMAAEVVARLVEEV